MEAEAQLDSFIAKFAPANQTLIREVRAGLRARFPTANELVWDNYNFFVIGYASSERPTTSILSLAADANGLAINFLNGADFEDPERILRGAGVQNRHVRLAQAAELKRPAIAALFDQAERLSPVPMPAVGGGQLIIRSISAKQRPRRRD